MERFGEWLAVYAYTDSTADIVYAQFVNKCRAFD